jgi:hypothetical protein
MLTQNPVNPDEGSPPGRRAPFAPGWGSSVHRLSKNLA